MLGGVHQVCLRVSLAPTQCPSHQKILAAVGVEGRIFVVLMGFLGGAVAKNLSAMQKTGFIPGLRRSPGEGNSKPLQYSCPENSMGREAWRATVHGVTKNRTRLSY